MRQDSAVALRGAHAVAFQSTADTSPAFGAGGFSKPVRREIIELFHLALDRSGWDQ